ncbi:pantoate-beta-alanine ligase [Coemansia sp. Benny D115]|nr:pantoate-beta-alanine ligase [Coemansia sp. Benny D115]
MSQQNSPPVFHTVAEVRAWHALQPNRIALVPTMGALHAGHLSLVSHAFTLCDSVLVSIFVNPAQFAPHEDLDQYPRTLAQDTEKLSVFKNLAIFAPSVAEMYPNGITTDRAQQQGSFVEVLGLSEQLEGGTRPHFFRGVATVVTKLFHIAQPDVAVFGQKDVQQACVLRRMVSDLHFPLEMRVAPTVRAEDGLALSSRNVYLTDDQRQRAPAFYRGLCAARELHLQGITGREELIAAVVKEAAKGDLDIEYISLSSPDTLEEVEFVTSRGAILSGAWRMGSTRLIDNILIDFDF